MPTYMPLGTNVRLVTYSLTDSTTTKPQRSKNFAGDDTRRAEQALLSATPLTETHIPCLEDATRLHFLGDAPFHLVQAGGDLFKPKEPTLADRAKAIIQQRAGDGVIGSSTTTLEGILNVKNGKKRSKSAAQTARRRSGQTSEASIPQALGLIITLSRETFIPSFDGRQKSHEWMKHQSIKYDVFFNGELAVSDFQSSRYRHGRPDSAEPSFEDGNIRIVSGKRVGMLLERPWVILPPSQNAGGGLREVNRNKAGMAEAVERWQALGEALLQRADEQGYNAQEERSPLGQYLAKLAMMEMPEAVMDMQKPGGHKFGVIDVIFTAGYGVKGQNSCHYLFGPEPLGDSKKFKRMPEGWRPAKEHGPVQNAGVSIGHTNILPAFPAVPEIDFNDAIAITPTKAEEARKNRGLRDRSPTTDIGRRFQQSAVSTSMPPPPTPVSRSAHTHKRRSSDTISIEESDSPTNESIRSARPGAVPGSKSVSGYMGMTKRGIFSKRAGAIPIMQRKSSPKLDTEKTSLVKLRKEELSVQRVIIKGKETPHREKILTSPYSLNKKRKVCANPLSPHQPLDESIVLGLKDRKSAMATTLHQKSRETASTLTPNIQLPSPVQASISSVNSTLETSSMSPFTALEPTRLKPSTSSGAGRPATKQARVKLEDPLAEHRATWRTPELSEDCVISFVEEGEWLMAAGGGSVLRHVKSARAGTFIEDEVIYAVRYIVAGETGLTM